MISCIIIDDQQHAIDILENYCERIPYLKIINRFTDPLEASKFINLNIDKIDLVFLDIEMPLLSGMDLLKAYNLPNVILATGNSNYALSSYEYGVVDYLLKPYSFDRFSQAVHKVYEKFRSNTKNLTDRQLIKDKDEYMFVKTERNKYVKVLFKDIIYIQRANNYSIFNTTKGSVISNFTLTGLEKKLFDKNCVRVHRSHIINMDYFESLEGNNILLKGITKTLELGYKYKDRLIKTIEAKL